MLKEILKKIIGCDTIAVRTFNFAQAGVVLTIITLHIYGVATSLPGIFPGQFPLLTISTLITLVFSALSFCNFHIMRVRLFAAISLMAGIITNVGLTGYAFHSYPPLDTFVISSPLLACWYFIAFLFIFEVEGYDASGMD